MTKRKRRFSPRHNRTYIIPSGPGVGFVLAVLGILLAATAYGNNQLYILTFMLIVIGIIAMHYTNANVKSVELVEVNFPPIEAKESGGGQIVLKNINSEDALSCDVELETEEGVKSLTSCDLIPGKGSARSGLLLKLEKRGVFRLSKIKVSSRYPLGLFYSWKVIRLEQPIYVYPSPLKTTWEPANHNWESHRDLHFDVQQGTEFDHIREYREGDSYKRIHWKNSAKGRPLATKEFVSEEGGSYLIDVNNLDGSLEARLEKASYLINKFEREKNPYQLKLKSEVIGPGLGLRHQRNCRIQLAKVGVHG